MLVADFTNTLHVSRRWSKRTTRVLNGLEEDSCNSVSSFELNHFFNAVRSPLSECVEVISMLFGAVEVGVGHTEGAGHKWFEGSFHAGDTGNGQRTLRRTVVGH